MGNTLWPGGILVTTESWGDCHLVVGVEETGWAQDLEAGSWETHSAAFPALFLLAPCLWELLSAGSGRKLALLERACVCKPTASNFPARRVQNSQSPVHAPGGPMVPGALP